jgi:transposase
MIGMAGISSWDVPGLLRIIDGQSEEITALRSELAAERAAGAKLEVENLALREQVKGLTHQVAELTGEVAKLKARVGSNSSNSSNPPSKDGPGVKKRSRSLRTKTGREPGGQAGHVGKNLKMSDKPANHVREYRPPACECCGQEFDEDQEPVKVERRQVFDLPARIDLEVTEHRIATLRCVNCHHKTKAAGVPEVSRQVQYGKRLTAWAVSLVNRHYVPLKRVSEVLGVLFNTPISPATIAKMIRAAAQRITEVFKPVAVKILTGAGVAHADETSFKVAGGKQWLHSFSSPLATWIQVHPYRGKKAIDDIGILPLFHGTLVHDCWAAYDAYENVSAHQLCCAHVARELQSVIDHHDHPIGAWCWAQQIKDAFSRMIHDPAEAKPQIHLIKSALLLIDDDKVKSPGQLGKTHAALGQRLVNRLKDYTRFTTRPDVPATNNPAEQEIRMAKIKQKIAGCMRTVEGASDFATIRSYLATARKHGVSDTEALTSLMSSTPWLPAIG